MKKNRLYIANGVRYKISEEWRNLKIVKWSKYVGYYPVDELDICNNPIELHISDLLNKIDDELILFHRDFIASLECDFKTI